MAKNVENINLIYNFLKNYKFIKKDIWYYLILFNKCLQTTTQIYY
jgi:hypothetical protein